MLEVMLRERGGRLPDGRDASWGLRHGELEFAWLKPLTDEAVSRRKQGLPDEDLTKHLRNRTFPRPDTQVHAGTLLVP